MDIVYRVFYGPIPEGRFFRETHAAIIAFVPLSKRFPWYQTITEIRDQKEIPHPWEEKLANMYELPGLCLHCAHEVIVEIYNKAADFQQRTDCPYCDADDGVVVMRPITTQR